ncbi:MAG: methyl-accepting chemotaxis protein [Treponema sp.]|jgi:methyl-accepting chemotaxis protein|nr:methyl-accepting chemotaxis protein [Treponema sp.]
MKNEQTQERRTSIKSRYILFSAALFLVIFIGGSAAFGFSMWQMIHTTAGYQLAQAMELERAKLETSVNGEIAIALKMAGSPLIQRHFLNPKDGDLKIIAFEEIAGYRRAFASESVFWASDVDKEFYFAEDNHYTVDTENPDNYWYRMTLYETDKFNFNINYNEEMQQTMLWVNAPVFDARRKPLGMVGTGIDLTEFVNTIYRNYKGGADLYIFNNMGEITGSRDVNLITNKTKLDKVIGATGAEILGRAKSDETQFFNVPEGVAVLINVPSLNWHITAILPLTVADVLSSSMTFLFLVMMAAIAVVFIISYLFISGMLKPMKHMVQMLDQIAVDWDLTRRLELKRHDEIGTVGEFFDRTFDKIKNLIVTIKEQTKKLHEISNSLTSNMTETAAAVNQITANIQSIKGRAINQSASVTETNATMEQVITNINKLNGHVENQSGNVSQVSSAIEEMVANVNSVTNTLVNNTENVQTLKEAAEVGRSGLQEVATDIQEIARESEGLLEINAVMENIASQTNLLSMNAAIEAAHAGEVGKGFAVVADEIRKLAESSSEQSKTIVTVLKKITGSITKITRSTESVLNKFEAIELGVKIVSDQEENIRNAMEEQGEGSKQVLRSAGSLSEITQQVKGGSNEMLEGSKEVINESQNLEKVTQEITGGMNEMASGAEQVNAAVNQVNEISVKNREAIDILLREISRFKVD